jgi:hypothetical protein
MSEVPLYLLDSGAGRCAERVLPPALKAGSNRVLQVLDLYWRLPESGGVWYTSWQ